MDKLLTVREARDLTGKSESTIKRLIREITTDDDHADRSLITPGPTDVRRMREAGEPYIWKIDRLLLLRRFPPDLDAPAGETPPEPASAASSPGSAIIDVLREQLQSKDQQIRTLETQLDRKDQQIADQNERMRESNVLMRELQARLAITAPAPKSTEPMDAHVDTPPRSEKGSEAQPEAPPSRQSIWTRPIHLFGRAR